MQTEQLGFISIITNRIIKNVIINLRRYASSPWRPTAQQAQLDLDVSLSAQAITPVDEQPHAGE